MQRDIVEVCTNKQERLTDRTRGVDELKILADGTEGEVVSMFVSKGYSLKCAITYEVDGIDVLVKWW